VAREQVVALLRSYLVGWKAYLRLADTPGVFADVDKWRRERARTSSLIAKPLGPERGDDAVSQRGNWRRLA